MHSLLLLVLILFFSKFLSRARVAQGVVRVSGGDLH